MFKGVSALIGVLTVSYAIPALLVPAAFLFTTYGVEAESVRSVRSVMTGCFFPSSSNIGPRD